MRFDFDRITTFSHQILNGYIEEGDTVIDATCGNGNDTLFLSDRVGKTGKVLAFDVQKESLKNTKELLYSKAKDPDNVVLLHESHHCLEKTLNHLELKRPNVIMFNLGYLPGMKEAIRTEKKTTFEAIKQSVKVLAQGGIISIIFYPHESGKQEWDYCREFISDLTGEYDSYIFERLNRNHPPFLVLITRK